MTKTILEILITGTKVFSEERRRHFSKKLLELNGKVDSEKAKVYPDYSDARVAIAQKELDNFTEAYAKEFNIGLSELLNRVPEND